MSNRKEMSEMLAGSWIVMSFQLQGYLASGSHCCAIISVTTILTGGWVNMVPD